MKLINRHFTFIVILGCAILAICSLIYGTTSNWEQRSKLGISYYIKPSSFNKKYTIIILPEGKIEAVNFFTISNGRTVTNFTGEELLKIEPVERELEPGIYLIKLIKDGKSETDILEVKPLYSVMIESISNHLGALLLGSVVIVFLREKLKQSITMNHQQAMNIKNSKISIATLIGEIKKDLDPFIPEKKITIFKGKLSKIKDSSPPELIFIIQNLENYLTNLTSENVSINNLKAIEKELNSTKT